MNAESSGSLPRNRKPVSNHTMSERTISEVHDPLFAVIELCEREESLVDPFICVVQGAPDAMCLLAKDRQLHDMARFCTDKRELSILWIDPTFNLGDFSVTVTTYTQLSNLSTKRKRVLLGPLLLHQRKTKNSYFFMASSIVGLGPITKLINLLWY